MESSSSQFDKIAAKIRKKYGSTSLGACRRFLDKIDRLTPELGEDVLRRFVDMVGSKSKEAQYSNQELRTFFSLCAAAQRGANIKDMKEKDLVKYKSKTLALKQSNTAQTQQSQKKLERSGDRGVLQESKVEQHSRQEPKVQFQSQIQSIVSEIDKPKAGDKSTTVSKDQAKEQSLVSERSLSFGDDSNSSIKPCISIKQTDTENHISPVQHSARREETGADLDISVRLVIDNISETNKDPEFRQVDTPTFTKRISSRFFESQNELTGLSMKRKINSHTSVDAEDAENAEKVQGQTLQITIDKYIKQIDGWSTVIRYEIKLPNNQRLPILRRYNDFVKLQTYLRENYPGIIIADLPPKDNLMAGIWGSDQTFLVERKQGLQSFLNRLLSHHIIGKDPLLLRFIDDQSLDQTAYNHKSLYYTAEKYLSTLVSITTSTEQLRDYGIAYLNYMKTPLGDSDADSHRITEVYSLIEKEREKTMALKQYMSQVEQIQTRKASVKQELGIMRERTSQEAGASLRREIERSLLDFKQAAQAYQDFYSLKANIKWLQLLSSAKRNRADLEAIVKDKESAQTKLVKIKPLLKKQMQEFLAIKSKQWTILSELLANWHIRQSCTQKQHTVSN